MAFMYQSRFLFALVLSIFIFSGCKKSSQDPPVANGGLSYGDSVFYLKNQSYVVSPRDAKPGTYTAYPSNLLIDNTTGNITVTITGKGLESQTGMRYKINYRSADGLELDSTYIVIAGINYLDQIYKLSQNDSIIYPVYNASLWNNLPGGTYGIQADGDLAINPANGQINIKECIRRGFFNLPAENGEWEEVTVQYRSNDNSNSATNRIDIALYFYNSVADIPSNVSAVMREHQRMTLGINQTEIPQTSAPVDNDLPDNLSISRPRPPCIIIVAN